MYLRFPNSIYLFSVMQFFANYKYAYMHQIANLTKRIKNVLFIRWTKNDCINFSLVRFIASEWLWRIKTFHFRLNNYRNLSDDEIFLTQGEIYFSGSETQTPIQSFNRPDKTVGRARPTSGSSFLMVLYKTENLSRSSYKARANGVCIEQD